MKKRTIIGLVSLAGIAIYAVRKVYQIGVDLDKSTVMFAEFYGFDTVASDWSGNPIPDKIEPKGEPPHG